MLATWLFLLLTYSSHVPAQGEPTPECASPRLQLIRNIKSGGFHREIEYSVNLTTQNFNDCSLWINETIPKSFYVNTDQLDDLSRLKKLFTHVSVFVNVETPEPEAGSHHLLIAVQLNGTQYSNVTLPIHLRYHAAQPTGGYVERKLELPTGYLNCSIRPGCWKQDSLVSLPCPYGGGACLFQRVRFDLHETNSVIHVPVGNSDHLLFVQFFTLLVTFSGSFFICKVLYKYRPKD